MLVFSEVVEMRRAVQRLRQSAPQRGQQRAQLAAPRARPQRHRRRYTHLYVLRTLRQLAQLRDHLLLFTFITSTTNYTCGRFLSKKSLVFKTDSKSKSNKLQGQITKMLKTSIALLRLRGSSL